MEGGKDKWHLRKGTHDVVMSLMKQYPSLRDNDRHLYAMVLYTMEIIEVDKTYKGKDLLGMIKAGALPDYENVRRGRAKIEERYPNLRGKTYEQRQKYSRKVSKKLVSIDYVGAVE